MTKKPPSSVTIGGMRFSIAIRDLSENAHGQMMFDERQILLNKTCLGNDILLIETLRHEMLHAALHVSGVSFLELYDEEALVRAIENIFFPAWEAIRPKL